MSMILMAIMGWFLTPVTESGTLFGRGGEISVERDLGEILYRIDLPDFKVTAISAYNKRRGLTRVDVAPRSKLVLVTWFELVTGYHSEVMDFDGNVLKTMKGVNSAVFIDREGKRMAIARSIYTDGERLKSEGVWIYDFETNKEEKILDTGAHLEWGNFDNSLYISSGGEEGTYGFRYDLSSKILTETVLGTGAFSPNGEYRWGFKDGEIRVFRRVSQEVVSEDFELVKSQKFSKPLYWMRDSLIVIPRIRGELKDGLLDVETGRVLGVSGSILSVTNDDQYVYICKPGLILEKLPMADLEVLYEGKTENANLTEEGSKDVGKNSDGEPR